MNTCNRSDFNDLYDSYMINQNGPGSYYFKVAFYTLYNIIKKENIHRILCINFDDEIHLLHDAVGERGEIVAVGSQDRITRTRMLHSPDNRHFLTFVSSPMKASVLIGRIYDDDYFDMIMIEIKNEQNAVDLFEAFEQFVKPNGIIVIDNTERAPNFYENLQGRKIRDPTKRLALWWKST